MLVPFIISSFIWTVFYKVQLLWLDDPEISLSLLYWLPSVFLYDALYFSLMLLLSSLAASINVIRLVRFILLFLVGVLAIGYLLALLAANTFLVYSGDMINFALSVKVSGEISNFAPMLASQGPIALTLIACYVFIFLATYRVTSNARVTLYATALKSKRSVISAAIVSIVYLLTLFYRPTDPWQACSENVFAEMLLAPGRFEITNDRCFADSTTKVRLPSGLKDLTQHTTNEFKPSFIQPSRTVKIDNFDFLRRSVKSNIKNVVWVLIESARTDIWPMNYETDFAQKFLTKETLEKKNITPFFEEFAKKALKVEGATTTVGFTIKSLVSGFCSMAPLPVDFSQEYAYPYYKKCLPTLLQEHGFSTKYFQTSSASFDNQNRVIEKTGFDYFSKENIDELKTKNNTFDGFKLEEVNYFGYQDEVIIPKMLEYVEQNQAADKPYFLSVLTNTNHHPYGTPSTWKTKTYTEDSYLNPVFNSIGYVDGFFENLMDELRKKDTKNDTLYVFSGDHGHVYSLTKNLGFEQFFQIPMLLYTENEKLKPLFEGQVLKGNFQNTDILPTILDILNDENFAYDVRFDYGYEGDSLMHAYRARSSTSLGNPGFSSMTYREHGFKLFFQPNTCKFKVFDILQNPDEEFVTPLDPYTNRTVWQWEKYAKAQMYQEIQRVREAYQFHADGVENDKVEQFRNPLHEEPVGFYLSVFIFTLYVINRCGIYYASQQKSPSEKKELLLNFV